MEFPLPPHPTRNIGYETKYLTLHLLALFRKMGCLYARIRWQILWFLSKNGYRLYQNGRR